MTRLATLAMMLALAAMGQRTAPDTNNGHEAIPGQQKNETNPPSLAETEIWIKNTFTDENVGQMYCNEFASMHSIPGTPGESYGEEFACRKEQYWLLLDECKATFFIFHLHWHSPCPEDLPCSTYGPDKYNDSVVQFNLADIDPSTIQIQPPTGVYGPIGKKTFHDNRPQVDIWLATTDDKDVMTITYPNTANPEEQFKIHEMGGGIHEFVTVEPAYAPRFAKALSHAVQLCGGKHSAF
jgi:hypothetical protein